MKPNMLKGVTRSFHPCDTTLLDEMKKMYPVIELNVSHDEETVSVKHNSQVLFGISKVSEKKNDLDYRIVVYWDKDLLLKESSKKGDSFIALKDRIQHGNLVAVTVLKRSKSKEDGI